MVKNLFELIIKYLLSIHYASLIFVSTENTAENLKKPHSHEVYFLWRKSEINELTNYNISGGNKSYEEKSSRVKVIQKLCWKSTKIARWSEESFLMR